MNQDEVIRRLKGLGHTPAPPAPDFTAAVVPVVAANRGRLGIGSIAAVVGVLALGTAALAIPEGGPLRQAVASLSTEVETDPAEVEAEVDADDSETSASAGATPCDGPPPEGTPAGDAPTGATVEVDPEDRAAQIEAWRVWREANCGPEATSDADAEDGDDDAEDSDDDSDDADASDPDADDEADESDGKGDGQGGKPGTHPHADDPCKGPPPHSNSPNNGQPERSAEERHAEREAWKQWHHENCPPGQANDHPGHDEGHGRSEDKGKPDDKGRPDGAGKPEDKPDRGEDDDS